VSSIKRFSARRIFSKEFLSLLLVESNRMVTDYSNYEIIERLNYDDKDLKANKALLDRWEKSGSKDVRSMVWFIPCFLRPYAGINNVLSLASYFKGRKIEQRFVLLGEKEVCNLCEKNFRKGEYGEDFRDVKIYKNPDVKKLERADVALATRWDTAFDVLKFNNTKGKFYLIQDDERLLWPGTVFRDLVECTYGFGFIGITNALELKYMYEREFGGKMIYYFPVPNKEFFVKPRLQSPSVKSIWFYARTRSERNGFHLGILALKEIKKRHPEVKVYLAGEESVKPKVEFEYEDVGVIRGVQNLTAFYSKCDVGMYLLFSKHTGIIPFELMASGCILLTNTKSYETYILKDKFNCVTGAPTPSSLADSFDEIYNNRKLRERILRNGRKTVKNYSKDKEYDKIYESITGRRRV
jgi:O-antigen biosynthesis protein